MFKSEHDTTEFNLMHASELHSFKKVDAQNVILNGELPVFEANFNKLQVICILLLWIDAYSTEVISSNKCSSTWDLFNLNTTPSV